MILTYFTQSPADGNMEKKIKKVMDKYFFKQIVLSRSNLVSEDKGLPFRSTHHTIQ